MQGQLMLRRAEPKDARTLFELRYLAYLRPYALYSSPENPCLEAFDGFAARVADQGQSQMYGLYLGTKPVGGAALCVRDGQVVLQELYVDPAMQGRGIGGQALRLLEARHPAAVYALEAPDDQGGGLFYQAGYRPTRQARQAGGRCQMFAWVKEAYKQVEILLSPLRREQLPALERMCADLDARRLYDFGGGALEKRPGVEALSGLLGAGKHHAGASRLDYAIEVPQYGAVIGLISLTELEWEVKRGQLAHLLIDPLWRGVGLGSRAVESACRAAFDKYGFRGLTANVLEDNQAALRCLERAGFRLAFRREGAFAVEGGEALDYLALMRRSGDGLEAPQEERAEPETAPEDEARDEA